MLAHGRWFSPASSTTKTGRHDIAEILLKVALNTKNSNSKLYLHEPQVYCFCLTRFLNQIIFSSNMTGTTSEAGLLTSLEHPNSLSNFNQGTISFWSLYCPSKIYSFWLPFWYLSCSIILFIQHVAKSIATCKKIPI